MMFMSVGASKYSRHTVMRPSWTSHTPVTGSSTQPLGSLVPIEALGEDHGTVGRCANHDQLVLQRRGKEGLQRAAHTGRPVDLGKGENRGNYARCGARSRR